MSVGLMSVRIVPAAAHASIRAVMAAWIMSRLSVGVASRGGDGTQGVGHAEFGSDVIQEEAYPGAQGFRAS
jgi:hypothetical protein